MLSERVYRWLLFVYPREHRREYGELMAQLFRDRMRRDGAGPRASIVWLHMILDLVGAAFEEHNQGANMRKLVSIGVVAAVVLIAGGIGIGTLLAQSRGEVMLYVMESNKTFAFPGTGSEDIAEAMREAVEDGSIRQEAADEIVKAFEEGDGPADAWLREFGTEGVAETLRHAVENGETSQATADLIGRLVDERLEGGTASLGEQQQVFVLEDATTLTFSGTGTDGFDETLRQAVERGAMSQDTADKIARSLAGDGSAVVWHYEGGTDGVAGAVRQAVEDGVISQALADLILIPPQW